MNLLFELFRGGLIFEVRTYKEAKIAEEAGALALLLHSDNSPIHPDGDNGILEELLEKTSIPVLASFHPGHFVEAEVLSKMGIWGMYADSRLQAISERDIHKYISLATQKFPLIADTQDLSEAREHQHYIPVLRGEESIEDILEPLREKIEQDFVFAAGPIQTVSDIALLKRMGADTIIIPQEVFHFPNAEKYLHKLVQASLYYDNSEKLAQLLEKEEEKK